MITDLGNTTHEYAYYNGLYLRRALNDNTWYFWNGNEWLFWVSGRTT